ncbi:MAG TPA: tetratricopeptide repeat protein [Longimicrobium sp.]|nr:tetratricopeptide repeat protein [Longimicrobium sp.]
MPIASRLTIFPLLLLALALLASPARAQETADQAWAAGRLDVAERLYGERLARDSSDATALHRMALIRGYANRHDEALALLDRLLRVEPGNREARVDRARVLAWRGDPAAAVRELDGLLEADPGYLPALEARAQFAGWAGQYDEALQTYGRILEITPGSRAVELSRARVLSWAARFTAAEAVYDSLLRADPTDRDARMGLAQVLGWASRLDSAAAVYRSILAAEPGDLEAQRWLARVTAWQGKLIEAERRWRAVLARQPNDAAALVGLSQTLRWQRREAAALAAASRAVQAAPTDQDARTELKWARLAVQPRSASGVTYESDSDGNRILTANAGGGWRPTPRLDVRGDAYLRRASIEESETPDGEAYGAALSLATQLEPGWTLSGAFGGSASDAPDAETRPSWRAAVSSPARYPVSGTLLYQRQPMDATALLIQREVDTEEVALSAQLRPGAGVAVSLAGGWTEFRGGVSGETNERVAGSLAVTRTFAQFFTLGVAGRTFSFERDLSDGYFDPDFYGIAEALGRYGREWTRWGVNAELAPGVQKVREDGDPEASFRATGGVDYILGPGRRIGLTAAYANAGLSRLSPTEGGEGYRYYAVGLNASWTF